MVDYQPEEYFEMMGQQKLENEFGCLDWYRFVTAARYLLPGSVLDIGTYYGDFLKMARSRGHKIAGTEANETRINAANARLGENVVVVDFQNGQLTQFADNSFDNVVCMEVLEHVPDHHTAFSELCRVANKRIIITVPFREHIQEILCLHCYRHTPLYGHCHSYDLGFFQEISPQGWTVTFERQFARGLARKCAKLPGGKNWIPVMRWLDNIPVGSARWLMVVLEQV